MGISNAMFTAVTGLDTFGSALSVVSDNIANANTTAFKSNSARFGDLVSGYYATQSSDLESQGTGTSLLGVTSDFSTGSTIHTGAWSNVMIQGDGFFNVQNTSGNTFYTRDGTFRVDTDGNLADMQGNLVLADDGGGIFVAETIADPNDSTKQIPKYSGYEIDKNGEVWGTLAIPDTLTTPPTTRDSLGVLQVSTFPNQEGLVRTGGNLYYPGASAGTAVDGTANSGAAGSVISGAIEGSNVDLASEMVNMIIYQSDYQANSKAISTANTMLETVVNLVR